MPRHAKKATAGDGTPTVAKENISSNILDLRGGFVNCVHREGTVRCRILTECQCIGTLKCGFFETKQDFDKRQARFEKRMKKEGKK